MAFCISIRYAYTHINIQAQDGTAQKKSASIPTISFSQNDFLLFFLRSLYGMMSLVVGTNCATTPNELGRLGFFLLRFIPSPDMCVMAFHAGEILLLFCRFFFSSSLSSSCYAIASKNVTQFQLYVCEPMPVYFTLCKNRALNIFLCRS